MVQFRKNEMNPLDYIYRAVGSPIRALDASDPMAPVILQYLYNSTDSSEYRVESIYQGSDSIRKKSTLSFNLKIA